jgi:hypothetical protein
MASDLLATIRSEIETRLDELRPLLSEYERLLAAEDALAAPEELTAPAPATLVTLAPVCAPVPTPVPAAPGELDTETDLDGVAEQSAPGEDLAPAPAGDGAAEAASGGDAVETIADAPWGRRGGRARRGTAAGAIARAASSPAPHDDGDKPKRVESASVQQAILAALGHGSHTPSELAMVTAMAGPDIRGSLSRLVAGGAVTRTKRDGKTAYALSSAAAETAA